MGKPSHLNTLLSVCFAIAIAIPLGTACTCHAEVLDTVHLKSGTVLKGEIKSRSDKNDPGRAWIVLETTSGAKYKLDLNRSVDFIIPASEEDIQYRKKARTLEENAGAHLELAKWCSDQKRGRTRFAEQIRWHYEQAVRLDPDHVVARRKLGFMKLDNGTWVMESQFAPRHGYFQRNNKWISELAKVVESRNEQIESQGGGAKEKLRKVLRDVKRNRIGIAELQAMLTDICNPSTIVMVHDESQKFDNPKLRRTFLDAIATVQAPPAWGALIKFALEDPDRDIREHALALLAQPEVNHSHVVIRLGSSLGNPDNEIINRAAFSIAEIASTDDYSRRDAFLPLIKSLITTHKVPTGNLESGRIAPTFGGGQSGFQTGGGKQFEDVERKNQQSLDALRRLTEIDFGYDESRWTQWYIQNFTHHDLLVGHDE